MQLHERDSLPTLSQPTVSVQQQYPVLHVPHVLSYCSFIQSLDSLGGEVWTTWTHIQAWLNLLVDQPRMLEALARPLLQLLAL